MPDSAMLEAATSAFLTIMQADRLMFMFLGVILGLIVGILPGIGGTAGTALLLPFTFTMDPYTAFAFLLGLGAVTSTGDTIPAVLFGVPGTSSSQATVLDGLPMAKRGEAGRALAAAYTASLLGGLFGALLLGISIPLLRPVLHLFQSPELLALSVFGIAMVALLSGNAPLRGLTAACMGVMLALIGNDPSTGAQRWAFGTVYLYDGLPLVPIALGLFALPELCDLAIRRTAVASRVAMNVTGGMMAGMRDTLSNLGLVLRSSWIGAGLGAIPGIGGAVVDWIAYGQALSTVKGARETFGKGDVRGVIAPEAANNAKDGGALVPTIVFGVPGSSSMAILLVAFMVHGLVPGPNMVTRHLDVTYSMVWSIAIANILGAGLCFLLSGYLARIALLRFSIIVPIMLSVVYVGAFEGRRDWGDLYLLLGAGVLGWTMKQLKWPRPPLVLGVVLGGAIERYMFISITRHGFDWLTRPLVLILLTLALLVFLRPLFRQLIWARGTGSLRDQIGPPRLRPGSVLALAFIGVSVLAMIEIPQWPARARLVPSLMAWSCIVIASLSVLIDLFRRPAETGRGAAMHMDLASDFGGHDRTLVFQRFAAFFTWLVFFMLSMATIGLIPTVPLFVMLYMRVENREPWWLVGVLAVSMTLFVYGMFDRLLSIPWPPTLLGAWFPEIRDLRIPSLR